jgi:hypothetical protein|tara:strand:+ start:1822 stop:2145 length:324 start_codon:yes stop_codon:yes gene_type:complete
MEYYSMRIISDSECKNETCNLIKKNKTRLYNFVPYEKLIEIIEKTIYDYKLSISSHNLTIAALYYVHNDCVNLLENYYKLRLDTFKNSLSCEKLPSDVLKRIETYYY